MPNLAGNCPDWDRIRTIADAHDLLVVEDSADTMGATLHGTPTGLRSDISVTSFAMSHIITAAGNGGMVMTDRDDWWDRALLRRRWGRSSEPRFFGTRQDERGRFVAEVDGLAYDALFVFEELGHNFEPSEMGAAFALVQLERMPGFLERRRANVAGPHRVASLSGPRSSARRSRPPDSSRPGSSTRSRSSPTLRSTGPTSRPT